VLAEVRGLGSMVAVEFCAPGTARPDAESRIVGYLNVNPYEPQASSISFFEGALPNFLVSSVTISFFFIVFETE
jgi:hypothetical protein